MRPDWFLVFLLVVLVQAAQAAPKPHVITFGKWSSAKCPAGAEENRTLDLKIRALYVDNHIREFTLGPPHDITERIFAVRRIFHLNDSLPDDPGPAPHWIWQQGGWLLVDRVSGRVSPVTLPEFDSDVSLVSWYRDYAAYCGRSEDGQKVDAVVVQVGRRKAIFKKVLGDTGSGESPGSACPAPVWQRQPPRVTFAPPGAQKFTYSIEKRTVDLIDNPLEDENHSD